jgi:hypothetical protein
VNTLWLPPSFTMWLGSLLVGALAGFWLVWDGIRLRRYLPRWRTAHDEVFGSVIGLIIAAIGIIGVIRYHWGG